MRLSRGLSGLRDVPRGIYGEFVIVHQSRTPTPQTRSDGPMPVNLSAKKLDPHDPALVTMMMNLQGNILKGHGRDHSAHLFVEFTGTVATNRAMLGALAARVVTSAEAQRDQAEVFRATGVPGGPFGGV